MLRIVVKREVSAHPGNRTPVSTVGGYYDTTTPDALPVFTFQLVLLLYIIEQG